MLKQFPVPQSFQDTANEHGFEIRSAIEIKLNEGDVLRVKLFTLDGGEQVGNEYTMDDFDIGGESILFEVALNDGIEIMSRH